MLHVLEVLAQGIGNTLLITFGAFLLGAILALPIVALRVAGPRPVRWLVIAVVDLVRAVPPIVWVFLIFFGLPEAGLRFQPVPAAILGLGVIAGAYLSEIYRAGIRGVPRGQWEAARAVGLSGPRLIWLVIVPQAVRVVIPPASTYLLGLLKDSALASIIGVSDVTFHAYSEAQQSLDGLKVFSIAAIVYLALSLPIAFGGRWLGQRLNRHMEATR